MLTGSKTFVECVYTCDRVLEILRKGTPGVAFELLESNIQNIVGNVNLGLSQHSSVNLETLHADHGIYYTYQKNVFPGLIFRPLKFG